MYLLITFFKKHNVFTYNILWNNIIYFNSVLNNGEYLRIASKKEVKWCIPLNKALIMYPCKIFRNKSQMPWSRRRASRAAVSLLNPSHLFFSLKAVPRCCWNPAWYFQLLMPEKSQWNKRFILDRSCHSEAKMTFISRAYTMTGVIFRTWQQELSKVEWNCSNGARRASFEAAKQHAMLHGPFKLYPKTECNKVLCVN